MGRFCRVIAVAGAVLLSGTGSSLAAETCWRMGSGQYFAALEYCVSSVQASKGAAHFGPKYLLAKPGSRRAWCSALGADVVGTWIVIRIKRGAAFRRLLISNGYGATPDIHARHGRIKQLKVITGTGQATIANLTDTMGLQTIDLPSTGEHASVRLEVVSQYPGSAAANVCLDYLTPDFEELESAPAPRR